MQTGVVSIGLFPLLEVEATGLWEDAGTISPAAPGPSWCGQQGVGIDPREVPLVRVVIGGREDHLGVVRQLPYDPVAPSHNVAGEVGHDGKELPGHLTSLEPPLAAALRWLGTLHGILIAVLSPCPIVLLLSLHWQIH